MICVLGSASHEGGTVALDWVTDPTQQPEPADGDQEPAILVLLPTLTSNGDDVLPLAEDAIRCGYRPVVFLKRGHGVPLTTPRFQSTKSVFLVARP